MNGRNLPASYSFPDYANQWAKNSDSTRRPWVLEGQPLRTGICLSCFLLYPQSLHQGLVIVGAQSILLKKKQPVE